ncbi:hypothetical protein TNCT_722661 [Trichonephila clavata]|uniref:Uncharacterized protein n=1 Tax=Trichonephila clavata TaxID=2740835 RepID=A0A8X6L2C8_TRICU|nr:hypothetical protein TNCT_722661 [Trichonephila clavata]
MFLQHSEFETEVLRIKKNSEASNSSAKRLSKLSYTSTSSANSELNEVFRAAKDSGKNSEISSDGTPPAYPKRPPPLPPNRPLPSHEIAKRNELSQALKSPEMKTDHPTKDPEKKQKPIPPPKPKLLFKSQTVDSPPSGEGIHKTEEPKPDSEENAVVRPSSPDYIVPNMHLTLRAGQKKSSDAMLKKMIEKFDKNHKKGRKGSESGTGSRIELSSPTVFANKNAKGINSPPPEESLLELPPQTLELLKKANLLSFPEEKSMFYVRRTRSYPNLRISQLQKQPIYLQLI